MKTRTYEFGFDASDGPDPMERIASALERIAAALEHRPVEQQEAQAELSEDYQVYADEAQLKESAVFVCLEKNPLIGSRDLARIIYEAYPDLFPKISDARGCMMRMARAGRIIKEFRDCKTVYAMPDLCDV